MIKKKQFKDINVGDIFYSLSEDKNTLCRCIKCEHYNPQVFNTMKEKDEWVDAIVNAVWLDPYDGYKAGTLDWFPEMTKVWVDEEN